MSISGTQSPLGAAGRARGLLARAAAMLAAGALLAAPAAAPPVAAQQMQQDAVTIEDLVYGDAEQYYGQQVTVIGDLGYVLGPRSFTLTDDDVFFGGGIPVVARQPITDQGGRPVDLTQWTDQDVRVTGTVHQFNLQAFEDQLGLDLDDDAWTDYAGQPAIIAMSVIDVAQSDPDGHVQDRGIQGR